MYSTHWSVLPSYVRCSLATRFYRAQRRLRWLCFCMCLSVILFTGGVCLSACWDTLSPQEQTPSPSTPPPPAHTPLLAHTPSGTLPLWHTTPPATEHAGRYGQCAGGTHPTGIQSCSNLKTVSGVMLIPIAYGSHQVKSSYVIDIRSSMI